MLGTRTLSKTPDFLSALTLLHREKPAHGISMRILFFVTLHCMLSTIPALGQNLTGQISGVVQDASGAVIPSAAVTVTNTDQNLVVRTLKSGAQGEYTVPLLAVGRYSIKVEAPGFQTRTGSGCRGAGSRRSRLLRAGWLSISESAIRTWPCPATAGLLTIHLIHWSTSIGRHSIPATSRPSTPPD